jgi:Na+-driven multidrug efflux pump
MPIALGYARTMMLAMPGLLVFILLTQLMRGVGDTVTPLLALGDLHRRLVRADAGVHPRLVRLPQLGVTSAAAASIASFLCALAFLAWYMRRRKHPLAPDRELLRALRIDPKLLKLVVKIGCRPACR